MTDIFERSESVILLHFPVYQNYALGKNAL